MKAAKTTAEKKVSFINISSHVKQVKLNFIFQFHFKFKFKFVNKEDQWKIIVQVEISFANPTSGGDEKGIYLFKTTTVLLVDIHFSYFISSLQ